MTTASRFSRQNDASLRALTVVLRENLVLVVVLVLESKALYYQALRSLPNNWKERREARFSLPPNTMYY